MQYRMPLFVAMLGLALLGPGCGKPQPRYPERSTLNDSSGKALVQKATQTLVARLTAQLNVGGPVSAIGYCKVNALALLDSVAENQGQLLGLSIRRVSERYRNPGDQPDTAEASALRQLGRTGKPFLQSDGDGNLHYYAPIVLKMDLCLQCHGRPGTDIAPATLAALQAAYPNDKATGYQLGDFRGMWHLVQRPVTAR
jgi:hypothetical protein